MEMGFADFITADFLMTLIKLFVPIISFYLVLFLRNVMGVQRLRRIQEELVAKKQLALMAVRFVEQFYKDYKGEEKYKAAVAWLSARLNEAGIKVTDEELRGLIEATLRELKDAFGEDWARIINGEDEGHVNVESVHPTSSGRPIGFHTNLISD